VNVNLNKTDLLAAVIYSAMCDFCKPRKSHLV